jgi:hypothetical protein
MRTGLVLAVCTALHNMEGGPELVMTLLEHGADVNEVGEVDGDDRGYPPMVKKRCVRCVIMVRSG